jgi:hypothetical protein
MENLFHHRGTGETKEFREQCLPLALYQGTASAVPPRDSNTLGFSPCPSAVAEANLFLCRFGTTKVVP